MHVNSGSCPWIFALVESNGAPLKVQTLIQNGLFGIRIAIV